MLFRSNAELADESQKDVGELFKQVETEDLIKFGLIPEFIGRTPITTALDSLSEEALYDILVKPRNALVKQYKKLFEIDGVELEFTEEAIKVIAHRSYERKTGARGLRSICEKIMIDVMFDIPSDASVIKCIITKEAALGEDKPQLVYGEGGRTNRNTKGTIKPGSRKSRPNATA